MEARAVPSPEDIAGRVERGEERALARLISGLEDGEAWAAEALRALRAPSAERSSSNYLRVAQIVGVTGPPGSGKSTLVDKLISVYSLRGERVGVLAVDPSSPFSGGAILGDRIRMQSSSYAPVAGSAGHVFIRSLASRGRLGGLSRATAQAARALEAAGYGIVLIETVGIGQSEIDVARVADTVLLVSMPGSGDDIQTIKAGVMEIGDIFVVNKADREGADRLVREIRAMLEVQAALRSGRPPASGPDSLVGHHGFAPPAVCREESIMPPVLKTVAETGEGVAELVAALDSRWATLKASGELASRRQAGAMAEARSLLSERVLAELGALGGGLEERLAGAIARGELEAAEAAEILYNSIVSKE
jgi:LAO/AO transport system kinase